MCRTDGDVVADDGGAVVVGAERDEAFVDDGAVLNIGVRTNADQVVVPCSMIYQRHN